MRKSFKNVLSIILCLVLVVGLLPLNSQAASPKLSKTKLTLCIGNKYTLKVKNTTKKVTWSSSAPSVATVSSNGFITAKKNGKTIIRAKVGTTTLKCYLLVDGSPSLEYASLTLTVGATKKIPLWGAKLKSAKSSDSSIVSVVSTTTSSATVKAKKKGTATLTVTDVWGHKYKCDLTINSSSSSTIKYTNYVSLSSLGITVKAPNKYNSKGLWIEGTDEGIAICDALLENGDAFTEAFNETLNVHSVGMVLQGDSYGFYIMGINSTPESEIIYNGDGTYTLNIGDHFGGGYKATHSGVDITKYCADAILCELAAVSSTPKTVYKKIYDIVYGETMYKAEKWYTTGDCKIKLSSHGGMTDDALGLSFTIKKK